MLKLFLYIIEFYFFNFIINESIKTKIQKDVQNLLYITISYGNPKNYIRPIISTSEYQFAINKEIKNLSVNSKTFHLFQEKKDKIYFSETIYFQIYNNNKEYEINNISLVFYKDFKIKNEQGYLGLALNSNNKEFYSENNASSLLENILMKLNNSKKVFYLDIQESFIEIGDYPLQYKSIKKKTLNLIYKSCKINNNLSINSNNKYDIGYFCNLDSLFFKNYNDSYIKYSINLNSKICLECNAIYTTIEFLYFLKQTYFYNEILNNQCELKSNDGYYFFVCKSGYNYKNKSPITLIFNEYSFKIKSKDLFLNYTDENIYFLIAFSPNKKGWSLGYTLLKNYITIFDIENNEIGFIPKKN